MAYSVQLTVRAQRDLTQIFERIHADSSASAAKWYLGLKKAVLSLEEQPQRCSFSPEHRRFRHLLYGKRMDTIYRILDKQQQVEVLHIRRGVRRPFREHDVS